MSNGFHRVLIRATFAALVGATTWWTPANAADGTAPKVSVTAPTAGQAISGTVTLSASASDDVGVQAVKWYVDGSEVAYDGDGAPWARSWNSATVGDGAHQIFAKAADAAGNWGTSATVAFTVANGMGVITVTAPTAGQTVSGTVTLSANVSGGGVQAVKWYVDGSEVAYDGDGAPWTRSWNSATVGDGTHQVFAKAAAAAGNWGTSATVAFTVANGSADVQVTIDRSVTTGTSSLATGATYSQYSLDPWGDPTAVANGKALLGAAIRYQNQHIYGWGAANPNPSPGQYDWRTLDQRIALIRSMGQTPVITLCCAPDWMTSLGATTSTYPIIPPTPAHYDDFAALARQIALRYPDVKYYQVWNEMKGFWSPSLNNWDYYAYTTLYNKVYDALKGVDPTIKVGGPYIPLEGTGTNTGQWYTQSPISARNMQTIDYWLQNAHGADFIVLSRRLVDWNDPTTTYSPAQLLGLTTYSESVAQQLRAKTSLPVWWGEDYCVGGDRPQYFTVNENWSFQAVCLASMLYHELKGGSAMSLRWQPQGVNGSRYYGNDENLISDTRVAGGGQPFPTYWVYRNFKDYFGPGTPLYKTSTSSPDIEVLASAAHTMLINKRNTPTTVSVNGNRVSLAAYEVRVL